MRAQAQATLERSLSLREEVLGPDHPEVASGATNLAAAFHGQRDYARAQRLWERASSRHGSIRGSQRTIRVTLEPAATHGERQALTALVEQLDDAKLTLPGDPRRRRLRFQIANRADCALRTLELGRARGGAFGRGSTRVARGHAARTAS